jgi:hypothetical protein
MLGLMTTAMARLIKLVRRKLTRKACMICMAILRSGACNPMEQELFLEVHIVKRRMKSDAVLSQSILQSGIVLIHKFQKAFGGLLTRVGLDFEWYVMGQSLRLTRQ